MHNHQPLPACADAVAHSRLLQVTPSTLLQPVMRPKAAVALLFLALLLVEYATSATAKVRELFNCVITVNQQLLAHSTRRRPSWHAASLTQPATKHLTKTRPLNRCVCSSSAAWRHTCWLATSAALTAGLGNKLLQPEHTSGNFHHLHGACAAYGLLAAPYVNMSMYNRFTSLVCHWHTLTTSQMRLQEEVIAPMGRGLLQGGGVNRKVGKTFRPAAKPKSKDKPSRRCAHGGCGGSRKLFTLVRLQLRD